MIASGIHYTCITVVLSVLHGFQVATFKSFLYTMDEIRDMWGEPAGKDLFFVASMTDYYYLETLTSTAITHIYQDGIKLKVLGRNIRTFKPGVPFNIQVSVNSFRVSSVL